MTQRVMQDGLSRAEDLFSPEKKVERDLTKNSPHRSGWRLIREDNGNQKYKWKIN